MKGPTDACGCNNMVGYMWYDRCDWKCSGWIWNSEELFGSHFEAAMKMIKRVQKTHAWAAFSAAKDHLAHLETAHKPWSKKINWLGASARKSKKAQNMSSAKCQMSISQVAAAVIIFSPPLPDMKGGKKNVDELLTLWQWCVVCGRCVVVVCGSGI